MKNLNSKQTKEALSRAIDAAGSQAVLAGKVGVLQSTISKWLTGRVKLTAERAVDIERAVSAKVSRRELRPDLFA